MRGSESPINTMVNGSESWEMVVGGPLPGVAGAHARADRDNAIADPMAQRIGLLDLSDMLCPRRGSRLGG
jgi:hypothetical protein